MVMFVLNVEQLELKGGSMKQYTAKYANGMTQVFYCKSVSEAIVTAFYYTYERNFNSNIISITHGNEIITNIRLEYEEDEVL